MKDIDMVRELLGEPPPPSGQATAQALARLEEGMTGRTPVSSRRRWAIGGAGAALVAAAAAVTLIATGGVNGVESLDPEGPAPAAAPQSAQTILLAAAHTAETTSQTGKYWHVKTLGTSGRTLGPKKRPYVMTVRQVSETWVLRDGQAWRGTRELPKKPASPKDEAAWKADGSPTRWDLGPGDTVGREHLIEYLKGTSGDLVKMAPPHTFFFCDTKLTFKQLQALPTDPAALRGRLMDFISRSDDDGPIEPSHRQSFLTSCLATLLTEVPVSPKVRAAGYRSLATMPGVTVEGKVRDDLGRWGIALGFKGGSDSNAPTFRLVFDPKTAMVLSQAVAQPPHLRKFLHKSGSALYLEVGWTDRKPQVPTAP